MALTINYARILTGILLMPLICGYGQDGPLIPYRKGALWGFSDSSGNLLVEPKYDQTFFFSPDGLARVKQNGLYGYINREGKMVIIPQYTNAGDFFMGVAEVEKKKRKYCINVDGDLEECNPPDHDVLFEEDNPPPFEVFIDSTGQSRLIFLHSGDTLTEKFDKIRLLSRYFFPTTSYFALVSVNQKWGAYNENGIQIVRPEFDRIDILDMKSFKALKAEKWGVMSFHGETILPFAYDSIAKVSDVQSEAEALTRREHYIVGQRHQFGIIDDKGNVILPLTYDGIELPKPCNCPLEFVVKKDGLYGLVDAEGKTILPIRYRFVTSFNGSPFTLVKDADGREGYVSKEGKEYFGE